MRALSAPISNRITTPGHADTVESRLQERRFVATTVARPVTSPPQAEVKASFLCSHLPRLAPVEQQGQQNHDAGGDGARGFGDVVFLQHGLQHHQEDGPSYGAPIAAASTLDRGT